MIFAVVAVDNPTAMGAAVAKLYPSEHVLFAPGQWLVVDKGTAKEVSDRLGVTDGTNGGALIVAVSPGGYFGRKGADLWEWIKVKTVQAQSG